MAYGHTPLSRAKRRSLFELRGDILITLRNGSIAKTRLMQYVHTDWKALGREIDKLQIKGMIESIRSKRTTYYALTTSGFEVSNKYMELMRDLGLI